jgi:membrane protease YdiL (CAAX protease family)
MTFEPNAIQPQSDSAIPTPSKPTIIVETPKRKPRLWTLLVTMLLATGAYVAASVASVIVMVIIYSASNSTEMPDIDKLMGEFATHPAALWILVMPGQLAILAVTLAATLMSPIKFSQRLALNKPHWPMWVTLAASAAAPLVSLAWSIPLSFVVTSSEHLEFLVTLFRSSGQGVGIIGLFLCVSLLPAISEEWLFRGYIQSRLMQRWHPVWAILLSSLLFAGFHLDPVHVVAVIPLGLWLGIMTYYSGSLIPAMIAHAYNNALSIIATVYFGSDTLNTSFASTENLIVLASGIPGLLLTLAWINFGKKAAPSVSAA